MVQITRSAQIESLPEFRNFIRHNCTEHGVTEETAIYDLQLAVDEASTNIIKHSYPDCDPGSIILAIEFEPTKIIVTITDFGYPFEPVDVPPPDLEAALDGGASGGFGLFIIHETIDVVEYESTAFGNNLKFVKNIQ